MQQQINLFQPVFRREEKVFSARALLQLLVIGVLLLVGAVALLQVQIAKLSSTRGFMEGQERSLQTQLTQLEAQADPDALTTLDARIVALEDKLAAGEEELTQIHELLIERKAGFAALLEALAQHPQPGLWLTDIEQQGASLELSGKAREATLVPQYLDSLSQDPVLRAWSLSTVKVTRDADNPDLFLFTLRSSSQEAG